MYSQHDRAFVGALIEGPALQVGPDGTLFVRTAAGEQAVIAGTVLF